MSHVAAGHTNTLYMGWRRRCHRAAAATVAALAGLLLGLGPGPAAAETKAVAIPAPELRGNSWLNVPPGEKLSLASRKGKVTVVHFWTFGCINCKRNLPFYNEWQKKFSTKGLEIIGIHSPETDDERDPANVVKKVKEYGITYPVLIDENSVNWKTWQQRYWPAVYLVDKQGRVRFAWEGELEYQGAGGNAKMTQLIQTLLNER
ncbi:MAG TPA: redoxin domain-containing protein [Verrucomicrobiae bacterium]